MSKLVPFTKFSKDFANLSFLSNTFAVMDKNDVPVGFVFGRDAFISFLEQIDTAFEENVSDSKIAYTNPAGKLIDLIEEHLPVSEKFVKKLQNSLADKSREEWVPLEEIKKELHV